MQAEGSSTRRHTIGLMPPSHTLTCTTAGVSEPGRPGAAVGEAFSGRRGGFIRSDYRHFPRQSGATPRILMVSMLAYTSLGRASVQLPP